MRNFSKVFPYHLSSPSRWRMLGAETSLNWDGFLCVVSYAGSSCGGCCCKGNESLIWSSEERSCKFPLILNMKLGCWWFPFLSPSAYSFSYQRGQEFMFAFTAFEEEGIVLCLTLFGRPSQSADNEALQRLSVRNIFRCRFRGEPAWAISLVYLHPKGQISTRHQ